MRDNVHTAVTKSHDTADCLLLQLGLRLRLLLPLLQTLQLLLPPPLLLRFITTTTTNYYYNY